MEELTYAKLTTESVINFKNSGNATNFGSHPLESKEISVKWTVLERVN